MKAPKVVQLFKKPVRRISFWCTTFWNGVSGQDFRRLQQLRRELAATQHSKDELNHRLLDARAKCASLEKIASRYQNKLQDCQLELKSAQNEIDELWQELGDNDLQIRSLTAKLANNESALVNCEANLETIQQSALAQTRVATVPHPTSPSEIRPAINLAEWKIAFVGGHEATRRVVCQILCSDYGLVYPPVEIPSHREAATSRKQLQTRLGSCHLIVSIVRYSSHSLTKSLKQLKDREALKGAILVTDSRGATGVVREILSFIDSHPDLASKVA